MTEREMSDQMNELDDLLENGQLELWEYNDLVQELEDFYYDQ